MFLNKLNLYYHTLKHVKATQLYHQVYYRIKNQFFAPRYNSVPARVVPLNFCEGILYPKSWMGDEFFSFLNLTKKFNKIDWNFSGYGKLWTYNLNYFDYLNQVVISDSEGLKLIHDFIACDGLKDGLEPYPISLRGINWIKFLSNHGIKDAVIDKKLYQDYNRLLDNLEYHLLANHILENGFSLLFGAYYFQDKSLYEKAKKILTAELEEQILPDGAHYELSPMYHQIILHRVLDCINLVRHNPWQARDLEPLLSKKAELMMGWLAQITFNNGDIPMVNDAAPCIAPATKELVTYASSLKIRKKESVLKESGYRKMYVQDMELLLDVGQIAPMYQPGHSHTDNLNFVLNHKNIPVIVDTGISTYEKNGRRQTERSTLSHNTVTIDDFDSSEVWGGFRVARRADTSIHKESPTHIIASHNGYKRFGIIHERTFLGTEKGFVMTDTLVKNTKQKVAIGHLHFHHEVQLKLTDKVLLINDSLTISFTGAEEIKIQHYQLALGFNQLHPALKIVYSFSKECQLSISSL